MVRLSTLAAALILVLSACGSAPAATGGQITVSLSDHTVQLLQTSVPSGPVTITVKNIGSVVHNLVVLRTDLDHDMIPPDARDQAKADERGKVGGTTEQLKAGQSVQIKLDLSAGKYVLICNELGHYQIGMHGPLTVN